MVAKISSLVFALFAATGQALNTSLQDILSEASLSPDEVALHEALAPASNSTDSLGMTSSAMEEAMTKLLFGKSAFGATPMGGSVKTIKDLLTKTMMPKVLAAHKADQNTLDQGFKALEDCKITKDSSLTKAKIPRSKYQQMSSLHKGCRNNEAVMYSSKMACFIEQKALKKEKELRCEFYAATSRKYGTQKDNAAIMKKAGSEKTEVYLTRVSDTICGRHAHGSQGEHSKEGGYGGGLVNSMLDKFLRAKEKCNRGVNNYDNKVKECKRKTSEYVNKKKACNQYQEQMDSNSCNNAIMVKDACESYAGCYHDKLKAMQGAVTKTKQEEKDRKGEWRGLKRMSCLINAFANGEVTNEEIKVCKNRVVNTDLFKIKYPTAVPPLDPCVVPKRHPGTGEYKLAEFAPLPLLAKGHRSAECSGMFEISVEPADGSPKSCKCTRVTLNGPYSAGAMVACTDCLSVSKSLDKSSCPVDTKIFAPASRADWRTFLASAAPLKNPHWIVDVTRPQNSCGGCKNNPMNSGNRAQKSWRTSDGAAWWLRSSKYSEPSGDYKANCYLGLGNPGAGKENDVTFNDGNCAYNSKSYYCQVSKFATSKLKPRSGSPQSCQCSQVSLAGEYSPGSLVRCEQCLSVSKSTQKNSCPSGMKIFSPRSRKDWKTFLDSAGPLRAPNWIIDVTRPQNGCGGCTKHPMKSTEANQATWRTSDHSSWWLRDTVYSQPDGDYVANCYLDLWHTPQSADKVTFNDHSCVSHSRSYYCQPAAVKCKCTNGKAATGPMCAKLKRKASEEVCATCHSGYVLRNNRCRKAPPRRIPRQPRQKRLGKDDNMPNFDEFDDNPELT